jgi:hypothetical protein
MLQLFGAVVADTPDSLLHGQDDPSCMVDQLFCQTRDEFYADWYIYRPGDGCDVIEDEAGINMLWLQKIYWHEIALNPTRHGKVQVSYQGQPIIRMKGIEFIRTENGCFSLDYCLQAM